MNPTTRSISLVASIADLAELRDFVEEAARELGADDQACNEIVLSADEMLTNVLRHGYNGNPGPVDLTVERDREEIRVHIGDNAPGFDPTRKEIPNVDLPLEKRKPGGLGIFITKQKMDGVEYHPRPAGGNVLTLVKKVR